MPKSHIVFSCLALVVSACNGTSPSTSGTGGTAGSVGGQTSPSGTNVPGIGGDLGVGGSTTATGAGPGAGGTMPSGTTPASGGAPTSSTSAPATTSAGGTVAGGTTAKGGSAATGGAVSIGGSAGSCGRTVGVCTAPTVTVTDVSLGIPVTGYGNESDTAVFPMAIAAIPSGGSRLGWMGTDKKVYVANLGCDDKLVGTPFSFPAVNFQDIIADDNGGVVLLTRNATNSGADNCGTGTICGTNPNVQCRTMWMVRFNSAGTVEWETQVTNLTPTLGGYQSGARFIWWYQHHGRLAFSGTNYAAFFGVAISTTNTTNNCTDIHQGDRLQIVSSTGALVSSGSLAIGMSHAWTSRVLWDPRSSKFMATDATDNNCRIANPTGGVTVAAGACDSTLFNGDLVMASHGGYWNAWSQGGAIRLEHHNGGASDKTVTGVGSSQHPHLVPLGANNMLLSWQSGTGMAAQVRSAGANAEAIGSQLTIAVSDHDFGAWKGYADGSAAYAASGSNNTSIKVARVMPCN